ACRNRGSAAPADLGGELRLATTQVAAVPAAEEAEAGLVGRLEEQLDGHLAGGSERVRPGTLLGEGPQDERRGQDEADDRGRGAEQGRALPPEPAGGDEGAEQQERSDQPEEALSVEDRGEEAEERDDARKDPGEEVAAEQEDSLADGPHRSGRVESGQGI